MNVTVTEVKQAMAAPTVEAKERKLKTFAVREVEKLKTTAVAFYVPIFCLMPF